MVKFILIITLLFPSLLFATPQLGSAPYAIQHSKFNCNAFLDSTAKEPYLAKSILWHSFGDSTVCLDRLLADKRLTFFEMHLVNESCSRFSRCQGYELFYGLTRWQISRGLANSKSALTKKFTDFANNAAAYLLPRLQPQTACYISPMLESNLMYSAAARKSISITRKAFKNRCQIVWNPMFGLPLGYKNYGQDVNEYHTACTFPKAPCIVNMDGQDMLYPGFKKADPSSTLKGVVEKAFANFKKCQAVFFWTVEMNCIARNWREAYKEPRARACTGQAEVFRAVGSDLARLKVH